MSDRKTFGEDSALWVTIRYILVSILIAVAVIGGLGGFRGESKRHGVAATTVAHEATAKN